MNKKKYQNLLKMHMENLRRLEYKLREIVTEINDERQIINSLVVEKVKRTEGGIYVFEPEEDENIINFPQKE